MGSVAVVSMRTNRPSRARPATSEPRVTGADQPAVPASTRPSTTAVIPAVDVTAPARSKRPRRRSVSTSTAPPTKSTARPMGTLTNITQRHEAHWVSRPPATRPSGSAGGGDGGEQPDGPHPGRPSGKMVVSRARAAGAARAPPTPCRARAASSIQLAVASPPASELTENRAMPARKVRRRPSRSPDRAPSRSRPPKVST